MQNEDSMLTFKQVFQTITRPGAAELWDYLKTGSFFEDPASTRYHMDCCGGLCRHSLNVYYRLKKLVEDYGRESGRSYSDESVAIVALLHDLCKMGCYQQTVRNQKTYDPDKVAEAPGYMVKKDSMGSFIWQSVMSYTFEDPFPYGHGEKSVYLIRKFMELSDEEAMAIRYHMGLWNEGEQRNAGKVFETNPLAFFLHIADEYATYIDET